MPPCYNSNYLEITREAIRKSKKKVKIKKAKTEADIKQKKAPRTRGAKAFNLWIRMLDLRVLLT
ncbi:hypothetical protein OO9_14511 [Providencia alcalifaciens Dmel2]|nr:hypothetical protein OO9_14511 [Providencia alcalifaciens Dmel2]